MGEENKSLEDTLEDLEKSEPKVSDKEFGSVSTIGSPSDTSGDLFDPNHILNMVPDSDFYISYEEYYNYQRLSRDIFHSESFISDIKVIIRSSTSGSEAKERINHILFLRHTRGVLPHLQSSITDSWVLWGDIEKFKEAYSIAETERLPLSIDVIRTIRHSLYG